MSSVPGMEATEHPDIIGNVIRLRGFGHRSFINARNKETPRPRFQVPTVKTKTPMHRQVILPDNPPL